MKKKLLIILILCFILIGLTGCGSKTATVINNENKTEELTRKELFNIYKGNTEKFKKYYVGAKISFDGTVKSVSTDTSNRSCYNATTLIRDDSSLNATNGYSYYDKKACATIIFKEGYELYIPTNSIIDVAEIVEGDEFHVETNIAGTMLNRIVVFGIDDDKAVYFDLTKMTLK